MRKKFIFLIFLFVIFFVLYLFVSVVGIVSFSEQGMTADARKCLSRQLRQVVLTAPLGELRASIADTPQASRCGLSFRSSLPKDSGMLFFFEQRVRADGSGAGIWMKDMRFPLDLVWLNAKDSGAFTVVSIERNVSPNTFPRVFYPIRTARYVLEINAGAAERFGIADGAILTVR